MRPDPLDSAVNRLARNMAITQVALQQQPPVALFTLNLEALHSSVLGLLVLLEKAPAERIITASTQLLGPATAHLLADIVSPDPIPDHFPENWRN